LDVLRSVTYCSQNPKTPNTEPKLKFQLLKQLSNVTYFSLSVSSDLV